MQFNQKYKQNCDIINQIANPSLQTKEFLVRFLMKIYISY